jgi:hypothetical protein
MIRDLIRAHRDKTPTQIAELMKAAGHAVNGQYVSTIKSNMLKKLRRKRKARSAAHVGNGIAAVPAALVFIKAAGGLQQAKAALGTLEEIGRVVG